MRLMWLATMIALVASVDPVPAKSERPAERATDRAQDVVWNAGQAVEQALYKAQNAGQDANQSVVQAEEEKKERTNAATQETTVVTIPESGGISIGNVVLLAFAGSVSLIGAWLIAYRATR